MLAGVAVEYPYLRQIGEAGDFSDELHRLAAKRAWRPQLVAHHDLVGF
jgi:hypothetical protein